MAGSRGTRMAAEELSLAERHKRARERIGNDPERLAERLSGIDRDAFDFSRFTDKQINAAYQGEDFDNNDYARLTGESSKPNTDSDSDSDTGVVNPISDVNDEVATIPTPVRSPIGPGSNISVSTNINSRGGDIRGNSIKGDNNEVMYNSSSNVNNSTNIGSTNSQDFFADRISKLLNRYS